MVTLKILICILLASTRCYGQPTKFSVTSQSTCFVADAIFNHKPFKSWWWQAGLRNVHARPTFKGFTDKWVVYINHVSNPPTHFSNSPTSPEAAIIEFAHKTRGGKCRFLIRRTRQHRHHFLGLTRPTACKPGHNGYATLFRSSLDNSLNREERIRIPSLRMGDDNELFVGYSRRKRMLTMTKQRNEEQSAWWRLDIAKQMPCPDRWNNMSYCFLKRSDTHMLSEHDWYSLFTVYSVLVFLFFYLL